MKTVVLLDHHGQGEFTRAIWAAFEDRLDRAPGTRLSDDRDLRQDLRVTVSGRTHGFRVAFCYRLGLRVIARQIASLPIPDAEIVRVTITDTVPQATSKLTERSGSFLPQEGTGSPMAYRTLSALKGGVLVFRIEVRAQRWHDANEGFGRVREGGSLPRESGGKPSLVAPWEGTILA